MQQSGGGGGGANIVENYTTSTSVGSLADLAADAALSPFPLPCPQPFHSFFVSMKQYIPYSGRELELFFWVRRIKK
jgi:hypothetical protein